MSASSRLSWSYARRRPAARNRSARTGGWRSHSRSGPRACTARRLVGLLEEPVEQRAGYPLRRLSGSTATFISAKRCRSASRRGSPPSRRPRGRRGRSPTASTARARTSQRPGRRKGAPLDGDHLRQVGVGELADLEVGVHRCGFASGSLRSSGRTPSGRSSGALGPQAAHVQRTHHVDRRSAGATRMPASSSIPRNRTEPSPAASGREAGNPQRARSGHPALRRTVARGSSPS